MAYDGSLIFNTKVDTSDFDRGLSMLKKAAGAVGFAKLGKEIIDVGSTFEASMSQVAAISMATGSELEALTDAAKEMGATTKYTAAEAADGLQYLALAGYSATESIEALPKVLRLAQAGGMDLAYASDLLTDSMAVMGLGIKDMDNFSDQLAMAASKSNTSVAQLGEAVLIAGGQAKLAAMSTEDMNTALGILADNGIKGSEGGTALRNTLKNLYTPTSASAKVMKKLGLSTADAKGNLRDAQDVLKDLKKALDGLSEADRMTAMGDIFDTRTIAAANALLENCGDRWDELSGYLSNCDGAAQQMADTMNDNLAGKTKIMQSAAEALGITIYEKTEPALSAMVTTATSALGALDGFAQSDAASVIGGLVIPLAAAAGGYGLYTTAVNAAKTAQMLFNAAQAASPAGLVIAGLAGVATAVGMVASAVKKANEEYYRMGEDIDAAGEKLKAAKDKGDLTQEYIDKWRDLNEKINSGALTANELAGAQKEVQGCERWFIDNYGEYITAEEEKNGVRKETVDLLERQYDLTTKTAELELESQLLDKASDIPELQQKVEVMKETNKALDESRQKTLEDKIELQKLTLEWENFSKTQDNLDTEAAQEKLNAIIEKANELTGMDFNGSGMAGIQSYIEELGDKSDKLGEIISDNSQKITDGEASIESYVRNAQRLLDFDMDATIEEKEKKAEELGVNLADGTVTGLVKQSDAVIAATEKMIDDAIKAAKKKADIRSPSHVFRDEVGRMISLGLAYGIEDGAEYAYTAMEQMSAGLIGEAKNAAEQQEKLQQRVLSSLKNTLDVGLITEEQYYTELTKLRDEYFTAGSDDWEKYTLEIIRWQKKQNEEQIKLANEQRSKLADINDDIVNDIADRFNEVEDARKAFASSLLNMEDGFSSVTYQGMGENGADIVDTVLDVNSLKRANDTKEAFAAAALAARERIADSLGEENNELTRQIYETIRNMGAEEGLAFSNAILNANDNTFAEWIAEQVRGAELNDNVSRSVYAEDMQKTGEQLAEELYSAWDEKLTEQFGDLPADFWDFGTDAAAGFYDGFMNNIDSYISDIEQKIAARISGYSSGGFVGGTNISGSYNTTEYNITATGGSEGSWMRAIKNRETIEKMTGGY